MRAARISPLVSLLAIGALAAGCGSSDGVGPAPKAVPLATATALNSPLPTGWPPGLQLPVGSTVNVSSTQGAQSVVEFETQELARPVADFLDRELVAAGFSKQRASTGTGTITLSYSAGTQTASVVLEESPATTDGTITLTTDAGTAG